MADGVRQTMLECEARAWLRNGYVTADKITELSVLITKHLGAAGAAHLVDEMRRQWRRRSEWLT
ncbi:DUF7696 family protein [Stutzerimonas stutzeri]|uniref:DUF7696 family protein n=1 Tax=Stutzerimonas stutzeri TaxID=316 RepID=UPI00210DC854|nr:hypothetical protein [Stutzerimonas stutzeri]MCQ4321478.1 hypothetical protein [Stutzerimonas stutzeri]